MEGVALGFLFWAASAAAGCPDLEITGAWIREAPPGAEVLAAYARIANPTGEPVVIDAVSSPDFNDAMFHRSVTENGVAHMVHEPELRIPARGSVVLEPGGRHLMLFDPVRPMSAGDGTEITLHCGAQARSVRFRVRKEP